MGKNERSSYLQKIYDRYQKADKQGKATILDEFCKVCEYHRKHAIRLLRKRPRRAKKPAASAIQKRGRKPKYDPAVVLEPLKRVWFACDQMCSKKLKAALPEWLPHYESAYEKLDESVYQQLLSLSHSTIDRLLKPIRVKSKQKGLCV